MALGFLAGATATQRRGMCNAILSQTLGILGEQVFLNGVMLVYLLRVGVPASRIPFYLAIPFGLALCCPILAHQADRKGKKRFGLAGTVIICVGYLAILVSSVARNPVMEMLVVLGIITYGAGSVMFMGGWFPIMNPLVPPNVRGRFWGTLRLAWQTVAIAFSLFAGLCLTRESPLIVYQALMAVILITSALRILFYARLPELAPPRVHSDRFVDSLGQVFRERDFFPFCSYIFLLLLTLGGAPTLFGMIEKQILGFSAGRVVLLGAVTMVGSMLGFWFGGKAIDRFGTKPAFLTCHIGISLVFAMYISRAALPVPLVLAVGLGHFLYGILYAVSNVAATAEMLALIPERSQSLFSAVFITMTSLGVFLAGALISGALGLGLLRLSWDFRGAALSAYDSLLLLFAAMALLFVVTLGLVPSVAGKRRE